jgi:energy-coupling factor transporter ATP-binding protein EcfA2
MSRITRLSLTGFRGATRGVEFAFDRRAPITLIFGENGSGKSTLSDAIDFICNGRFGSLQDKSASLRAADAAVAHGTKAGDVSITLETDTGLWTGRIKGSKPEINGPGGRPVAHVLRRSDIARVVEATPKEKYEALRLFVTFPSVERAEKTLREALTALRKEIDTQARSKQQADEALDTLWRAQGKPDTDAEAWGRTLLLTGDETLRQRARELQQQLDTVSRAAENATRARDAQEQRDAAAAHVQALDAQQAAASSDDTAHRAALIRVLNETLALLDATPGPDACPVCGQPVNATHLREHLQQTLSSMTAEVARHSEREQAVGALQRAEALLSAARQMLLSDNTNTATDRETLRTHIERDQRALGLIDAVREHLGVIEASSHPLVVAYKRQRRLERMLEIVETKRKAHVEQVLTRISATVDDLYARIHRGEDLGGVRVYLKPGVTGSLEMDARFASAQDIPPASYYSEAHLDTLGLCVYLALAKHSGREAIVVLDDVLTSIDDAHLTRVIQLLHDEAAHFNQIIITTHFRAWRDKYRYHHAPGGQVQLIQLHRWSLDRGIRHSKDALGADELRDLVQVEPLDRQGVASKAGILLESMLGQLAQLYRIRLPLRADNDHGLVELARGFDAKLKRALVVTRAGTRIPIEPLINAAERLAFVRNQVGAHANAAGADIPDRDVLALGEAALALADALVCPGCGAMPLRARSGVDCECSCGTTRLEPVQTPT